MILNSTPENQAILSNVGTVNSFTIKATAKSFKILSDGLYQNKLRAIIRELSCNALDSHVAAGKPGVKFEVHLPTSFEPWFSVRDYGTGLNQNEVTNIFTTFFESTKTESNDFVGALGLGSKSPFSYTDNFTVTAIKHGTKGIYSAFINEQGVPSIALLSSSPTDEFAGVEIKFSVNDRYDYSRFSEEAKSVFQWFDIKPVITGQKIDIPEQKYLIKDIIPGVHQFSHVESYGTKSVAVMGNICYPINIPESSKKTLGSLSSLLNCGLVLNFKIGELDFQASREGLSYIDLTINSIKTKLEQVRDQLVVRLAEDADKITNDWEKAFFLDKMHKQSMWNSAVENYVAKTKFDLVNPTSSWDFIKKISCSEPDLASKFNIQIRAFNKYSHYTTCNSVTADRDYHINRATELVWNIPPNQSLTFVVNDTKVGVFERAKFHWRNLKNGGSHTVYVLDKADKTKEMDTDAFFKMMKNPPDSQIRQASTLNQKARANGIGKNVTLLKLVQSARSRGWGRDTEMVWRDAGSISSFGSGTHYYLPLSGFTCLGQVQDVKTLSRLVEESNMFNGIIYGVRKGDIEEIKKLKNWVNLDEHIKDQLIKMQNTSVMPLVKSSIDFDSFFKYNKQDIDKLEKTSPFRVFAEKFFDVKAMDDRQATRLEQLASLYDVAVTKNNVSAEIAKYKKEMKETMDKYPMLQYVSYAPTKVVVDYITLMDKV